MNRNRTSTTPALRTVTMLVALAAVLALAAGVRGDTVRLRSSAACPGPRVTLAEVAELDGAEAQELADMTVADLGRGATTIVSLDAVRAAMGRRNVHWGRLSLVGVSQCRVTLAAPPEPARAESSAAPAPAPAGAAEQAGPTVRDRLAETLARMANVAPADIRVTLSPADEQTLASANLGDRFEFEPLSGTGLGRVPVTVRRWRGDRPVEALRIAADVARRTTAVVAIRQIDRGNAIQPNDIEIREVFTAESLASLMTDVSVVAGKVALTAIKPGTAISTPCLRAPTVVRRGDAVNVRCVSGGIVLKLVARAGQDGGVGDVIAVRNERTRDASGMLNVKVTGPGEGVVVVGAAGAGVKP